MPCDNDGQGKRGSAKRITRSDSAIGQGITRRQWLTATGAAGTLGLSGCVGSLAGQNKPDFIRYLGWGGNTQDSAKQLFKKWSKESGVEVKHQSAGGDSEFISILQQNPGKIDIVNFSSFGIAIAREQDMLSKIDFSKVPNYTKNMQKDFRNAPYVKPDKQSDTLFRDPVTQGFTYNTDMVDKKLDSWDALLDQSLKNKISLRDDPLSRFANAALATGSNINKIVQNDSAYQKTVNRLKKEDQNVLKYWGAGAQAIRLLREKNVAVSEIWGGRTLALKEAGYDQMEYVLPKEGAFVLDENYNFPKASNKTDTALDLINWSYKRENAIELTKNLGYPVMIKNPPKAIKSLPDYVSSVDQLSWPDYSTVPDHLGKMQRDFQKIKG